MIGRVVGSYEIVERIGEGGMGTVYRALDPMLEREVAVKAIRPELARDPQVAERFRAEAKLLARVNHPAIATIYSFFREGEELFLAMEFVRGRTLASVLREEGPLPWRQAVQLLAAALEGIEQVHRLGIVHRDLKPDNLMLTEAGSIKVMDFGIARATGSDRLTRTGLMVGTLRYMPPEQLRGEEADRRADVYALGAVLYETLAGRVPFVGGSEYEVIRAHVEDQPAPPSALVPDLPAWLDRAALRALAKDPADRFQSAEEFRAFLTRGGHGLPVAAVLAPGAHDTYPQRAAEISSLPTLVKVPAASPSTGASAGASAGSASSYRAVEPAWPRGRRAWTAVAAGGIVAAGLVAWVFHAPAGRSAAREAAPAAAVPARGLTPPAAVVARGTESPVASRAASVTRPSERAPEQAPEPERPRRASAAIAETTPKGSSTSAPTPVPAAPVAAALSTEPAPTGEPAQEISGGPAPGGHPSSAELKARLEELRATSRDLEAAANRMAEGYRRFLEPAASAGRKLKPAEERLQIEIEDIASLAARFRLRLRPGAPPPAVGAGKNRRAEILAHARRMDQGGQRIDRLIALVRPGAEVEGAWQDVKRLSREAVEILTR